MRDDRKKLIFQGIQLRQLLCLFFEEGRLAGDIRLLPQDLQVAAAQLPVLVPHLLLVTRILIFDQQQPVENKKDGKDMVEDIEIIMGLLQVIIIILPYRTDQQVTGHRQGEGKDDVKDPLQEEYRQDPIQDEKKLD